MEGAFEMALIAAGFCLLICGAAISEFNEHDHGYGILSWMGIILIAVACVSARYG